MASHECLLHVGAAAVLALVEADGMVLLHQVLVADAAQQAGHQMQLQLCCVFV